MFTSTLKDGSFIAIRMSFVWYPKLMMLCCHCQTLISLSQWLISPHLPSPWTSGALGKGCSLSEFAAVEIEIVFAKCFLINILH